MVIDCQSMVIANMGSGMIATPGTGIVAGMDAEVDLKNAHPKVGEGFYLRIWARSVGTPCGGSGVIPIFSLPPGVSVDTSKQVVCFFDGQAENNTTCPQPGAAGAKFQSAQSETGNANSYKILCGYASGCLGYAWPVAYGHGMEFAIPIKSSNGLNSVTAGGGAWVIDATHNGLKPLQANLNVFAATAGNGQPPAQIPVVGGGTQPDPATAYRIVYDNPSTYASPNYPDNPGLGPTTFGFLSTATAYTNGVPGYFMIARDADPNKLAAISNSLQTLDTQMDNGTIPVMAFTFAPVGTSAASWKVDYDWGEFVYGTLPWAQTPGVRYHWKLGFAPTPNGNSDIPTAKVIWGAPQSYVSPGTAGIYCDNKKVTVSLALGQQPTDGDDVILGTPGNDSVNGGKGDDTICGLAGNDFLAGGPGNDKILAGDGDDIMQPGTGNDTAYGEAGNDTLSYGDLTTPSAGAPNGVTYKPYTNCNPSGTDVCGAGGNDNVSATGQPGPERFAGSRFDDEIVMFFSSTRTAFGDAGNDNIGGSMYDDTINGGSGSDTINAGAGNDNVQVRDGEVDQVNCDIGTDTVTADRGDQVTGCESILLPPIPIPEAWVAQWPTPTGKVKRAKAGKVLRATTVTFAAAGAGQQVGANYQWYVGGVPAPGATGPSYKVPKKFAGKKSKGKLVTMVVTLTKPDYLPISRTVSYGKVK